MKRVWLRLYISALFFLPMTSCSEEGRKRFHAERTKDPKDLYEYGCYLIAKRPRNFYADFDEGRLYIERSANMGYSEAMYGLAALHAMGSDSKSLSLAVHWYSRASESGSRKAMGELENAYRYGQLGLVVDAAKADYWGNCLAIQKIKDEDHRLAPLRSKAERGDVQSMVYMGHSQEGRGETYWKEAVEWYARAGDAGNAEACMRLVEAYREGKIGLPKDEVKCDQWFRKWQQAISAKPDRRK